MSGRSEVHAEMKVLSDARKGFTAPTTIDEQRRQWTSYTAAVSRPPPPELDVRDTRIPAGDHAVPVRIYCPDGSRPLPCILYMHGGGFMLGDLESSDSIAWGFAHETGATVVSVDYRLTPEHPWPAAFDDCYGVLKFLAARPGDFSIDGERIALAGDSAGGRLTAGMCLKARDEGRPRIVAQAMIYASAGAIPDSRSAVEFAEGHGLTTAKYRKFYEALFPDHTYDADPYAWPVRAPDHSNLPPALIHSAEIDPIRDDGRAYAAKLALAGSPVTYREASGMIHGFMRARFFGPAAKAEFDAICTFLRGHLFP